MKVGTHEVMDLHEKLSQDVAMIDHFALYINQCSDGELKNILQRQQKHMIDGYNTKVSALQGRGVSVTRTPRTLTTFAGNVGEGENVNYGMQQTKPLSPRPEASSLNDQIIASGALSFHKCSAVSAVQAALECADSNLRNLMMNSARDCTEMAYEIFQYMNRRGWYQVPTMPESTLNQMQQSYTQTNAYI